MLSRLSGLANTVLQELSGDGSDAQVESSATVSTLSHSRTITVAAQSWFRVSEALECSE